MKVTIDESISKTISVHEDEGSRYANIEECDGEFQHVDVQGLEDNSWTLEDWTFLSAVAATLSKRYTKEGTARKKLK